jgi:hydrogenase maturation protease
MRARVVALGRAAAGDDGVGRAVIEALRGRVGDEVELIALDDPSALVSVLETRLRVVLVDAILGAPAGEVLELSPDDLAQESFAPVSSHGISAAQAIAFAEALAPGDLPPIQVVAICIAAPAASAWGLSPAVAAAVPGTVDRILAILELGER